MVRPGSEHLVVRLGGTVAAGGDTLGRLPDGRVLFCEGGLPGETVRVELVGSRRDYARGRVADVEDPSPHRRQPPCPHVADGCGGCQWQHVEPAAQPALKAAVLADSFRRLARMEPPPGPPPRRVPEGGYRTSLRMTLDAEGRMAYRHRRSHSPLAVGSCAVADPRLEDLVVSVRARPPRTGREEVGLRVGVAGGERLVLPSGGATVVYAPIDATVAAAGHEVFLHETAGGRRWRVSGRSFFQSGPAAAEMLVAAVTDAAGDVEGAGVIVDLYAGVGLLGGCLAARSGVRLVAVESSAAGASDAAFNLADLDAAVHHLPVDRWAPEPAGLVIADPGRPGLGRPGAAAVAATGAPTAVVVSCDPASAARDASLLAGEGYRPVRTEVLDLFPDTFHLEAVTTYRRQQR